MILAHEFQHFLVEPGLILHEYRHSRQFHIASAIVEQKPLKPGPKNHISGPLDVLPANKCLRSKTVIGMNAVGLNRDWRRSLDCQQKTSGNERDGDNKDRPTHQKEVFAGDEPARYGEAGKYRTKQPRQRLPSMTNPRLSVRRLIEVRHFYSLHAGRTKSDQLGLSLSFTNATVFAFFRWPCWAFVEERVPNHGEWRGGCGRTRFA